MLHQSHLLANDKSDNEMQVEAVHRSHGIYLTPGKPQLGDCLMKAVQPVLYISVKGAAALIIMQDYDVRVTHGLITSTSASRLSDEGCATSFIYFS